MRGGKCGEGIDNSYLSNTFYKVMTTSQSSRPMLVFNKSLILMAPLSPAQLHRHDHLGRAYIFCFGMAQRSSATWREPEPALRHSLRAGISQPLPAESD